jgi:hypothetical protein
MLGYQGFFIFLKIRLEDICYLTINVVRLVFML